MTKAGQRSVQCAVRGLVGICASGKYVNGKGCRLCIRVEMLGIYYVKWCAAHVAGCSSICEGGW